MINVALLDISMRGHEGGMPRIYYEIMPCILGRIYK